MLLAYGLALWVALSAGLHLYLLKKKRRPVPVIAGGFAAFLGIVGGAGLAGLQALPRSAAYHDTYYTFSPYLFLFEIASVYLIAAVIALIVETLANAFTRRLLTPAFWTYHLGAGAVTLSILPNISPVIDGHTISWDAIYWFSLTSTLGGVLVFLGVLALLVLLIVALAQQFLRRRGA